MTVLVAIPYWNAAPWIERAVRSVLAQTHRDLACVVIGDGEVPPLPPIRDDRLVVYSYPTNRGAYFAQDVAIWASPFEWYGIVAADDWVDPDHIERLLSQKADLCAGGLRYHNDRYCPDPAHRDCSGTLVPSGWAQGERKPYEVGLYRTERYREIGAHNPAERLGQDSLTLKVMRLVAPVGVSRFVTYHRLGRPGSLCTDPATDVRSRARIEMRARNRAIADRCEKLAKRARANGQDPAAAIRRYRDGLVPVALKAELAARVDDLRSMLGASVPSKPSTRPGAGAMSLAFVSEARSL